jgi:hypothetical protein
MSNHLILPIDIQGTKYCVEYHGKRATEGVNTSLESSPTITPEFEFPASPWPVPLPGETGSAEISFGVGCGSSVTIGVTVTSTDPPHAAGVDVYINGDQDSINYYETDNPSDEGEIIISLDDLPCGNLITLTVYVPMFVDNPSDTIVTIEILSIT